MKKNRFRLILNIAFYLNVIILSIYGSKKGIENVNDLLRITPYFFIFIYICYFGTFGQKNTIKYALIFFAKFAIMIIGYIASAYKILSNKQIIFFGILLFLIIVVEILEYIFYKTILRQKNNDIVVEISEENLKILMENELLTDIYNKASMYASKVKVNFIILVISYVFALTPITVQNMSGTKLTEFIFIAIGIFLFVKTIYEFYFDFIKSSNSNRLLSYLYILFSFIPFTFYLIPQIVITAKKLDLLGLLAILFALPLGYRYYKEQKKLWTKLANEHNEIIKLNN